MKSAVLFSVSGHCCAQFFLLLPLHSPCLITVNVTSSVCRRRMTKKRSSHQKRTKRRSRLLILTMLVVPFIPLLEHMHFETSNGMR